MNHIFISYSHLDHEYAHSVAEALENYGFQVWIDDRIDYGLQWPRIIEQNLESCAAFIVIMSPNSYNSEWVQNELNRAKRKNKRIFPLLLEGDEPWLAVETTQYVDVTNKRLPPTSFFTNIATIVPTHKFYDSIFTLSDYLDYPSPSLNLNSDYEHRLDVSRNMAYHALKHWYFPSDGNIREYLDSLAWVSGVRDPQSIEDCISSAIDSLEGFQNSQLFKEISTSPQVYRNIRFTWRVRGLSFRDEIDTIFLGTDGEWHLVKYSYVTSLAFPYYDQFELNSVFVRDASSQYHFQVGIQTEAIKRQFLGATVNSYICFFVFPHVLKLTVEAYQRVINDLSGAPLDFSLDPLTPQVG
jgi:hypothetical protein